MGEFSFWAKREEFPKISEEQAKYTLGEISVSLQISSILSVQLAIS